MKKLLIALPLLLTTSCFFSFPKLKIQTNSFTLKQVEFSDIDGWQQDDHRQAVQSFAYSCNRFAQMPKNKSVGGQIGNITADDFRDVCDIAEVVKGMSAKQAKNFFENWFKPFLVSDRSKGSVGLFTGYYVPEIKGSLVKTTEFSYPIYSKPSDLTDKYLTRQQIEEQGLEGKSTVLAYVASKADLFFMQIQGSGRIILPNNEVLHLAYDGRNGYSFNAIANYMMQKGYLRSDQLSPSKIKQWLNDNEGEKADDVMWQNPLYIFFKKSNSEYAIGAQGVPLTATRSLAIDDKFLPYGLPIMVDANDQFQKLMVTQDTGSAINGAVRGDIFFGYGSDAENDASAMYSKGSYYILLPVNLVDKIQEGGN